MVNQLLELKKVWLIKKDFQDLILIYMMYRIIFKKIQIRDKRHELNCLQHDYMELMSQIELLLQNVLHFIII